MQHDRLVQIPLLRNPYMEGIKMSDFRKLSLDMQREYAIYYRLPRAAELSANEIYSLLRGYKWIPALKHHVWIPRPDYKGITVSRDIEDLEKWYTGAEERVTEPKNAGYARDPWSTRNYLRKQWTTAQSSLRESSTRNRSEAGSSEAKGREVESPANIPTVELAPSLVLTEAQIALSKARKALTSSNTYRRIGRHSIVLEGDILWEAKKQRQNQKAQTRDHRERAVAPNSSPRSINQSPPVSPPRASPQKASAGEQAIPHELSRAPASSSPSRNVSVAKKKSRQKKATPSSGKTTTPLVTMTAIAEVAPTSAASPSAQIHAPIAPPPPSAASKPPIVPPEQPTTFSDHKRLIIKKADQAPLPELTFEARNKKDAAAPPPPPLHRDLVYIACTLRSKNKDEHQAILKGLHDEKKHSAASTFTNGFKLMFPGALSHAVSSGAYAAVSSIQNVFGSQRSTLKRSRAYVDDDAEDVRSPQSEAVSDDLPAHRRKRARCDSGPSRTHIRTGTSSAPSCSSLPVSTSANLFVPRPRATVDRLAGFYRVDEASLLQSHAATAATAGAQAGPSSRRPALYPSTLRKASRRNAKRKRT